MSRCISCWTWGYSSHVALVLVLPEGFKWWKQNTETWNDMNWIERLYFDWKIWSYPEGAYGSTIRRSKQRVLVAWRARGQWLRVWLRFQFKKYVYTIKRCTFFFMYCDFIYGFHWFFFNFAILQKNVRSTETLPTTWPSGVLCCWILTGLWWLPSLWRLLASVVGNWEQSGVSWLLYGTGCRLRRQIYKMMQNEERCRGWMTMNNSINSHSGGHHSIYTTMTYKWSCCSKPVNSYNKGQVGSFTYYFIVVISVSCHSFYYLWFLFLYTHI